MTYFKNEQALKSLLGSKPFADLKKLLDPCCGAGNLGLPYKVYTALLTQSGTNAPEALVLENTIGGGDAIYSRDAVGEYTVIFGVDIFTSSNAYVFISSPFASDARIGAAPIFFNAIGISSFSGGVNSDDVLGPFGINQTPTILEIRLYN